MEKVYNISFNINYTDDTNLWKVIDVESERVMFFHGVVIDSKSSSSSKLYKSIGEYRHFITCDGSLEIIDGVAYIKSKKEAQTLKRHLLKTISYRVLATSTTILGAFYIGVGVEVSVLLGAGEIFLKPILYFIHERVWYNSKYWHKK